MRNIIFLLGIILLMLSCSNGGNQKDNNIITVSILPQKYFIDVISGNRFTVNVMVPPGASPASYEPSPKQMKELSRSKLYFRIGHIGFEKAWIKSLAKQNPDLKLIDQSKGTELIYAEEHRHGDHVHKAGEDPHIWLSPKEVKVQLKNVYEALSNEYPIHKTEFETNYKSLQSRIDSLHFEIESKLKGCENRNFIIFHPALSYFARDYNLIQTPIEVEGKEPNPAEVKKIIDLARKENIKVVFIQKEFDIENAQSLANEINAKVIQINPLEYNWYKNMLKISETLSDALCSN